MKVFTIRTVSLLALLATALSASAQTGFYGGDYDGNSAVLTEDSADYKRVFDDFTLGEGTRVSQVFGNFVGNFDEQTQNTFMYYEIRRNVKDEDGGELLYSGKTHATVTYAGEVFGGITEFDQYYRVTADVEPDTLLGPGTYFLGLAFRDAYLMTTAGANATGGFLNNDISYFDSINYGRPPFESLAQTGNQGATDFSMGMVGRSAPVPEPASMVALGAGVVAVLRRKRR